MEKRAAIRRYYEQWYQGFIDEKFDVFCKPENKIDNFSREFFKRKINFLVRERNLRLAELDQATEAEVNKLYKEIFNGQAKK